MSNTWIFTATADMLGNSPNVEATSTTHTDGCRRMNSRPRQERCSETWRRKMSWLIMSSTKLNNWDEDYNNNAVGLIRAGSGPCCLGSVSVPLCQGMTNRMMMAASPQARVHQSHRHVHTHTRLSFSVM